MLFKYCYMRNVLSRKLIFIRNLFLLLLTFSGIGEVSSSQSYTIKLPGSGAISSGAKGCAEIGRNIMAQGGNVIDTAIATAFCEGVVNPTTMGLGGGFIATVYDKTAGKVFAFNSRETAPAGATVDMFKGNETLSTMAGLSVAVPSELIGYWHLYKNYGGKVPWRELVFPAIKLCLKGIPMTNMTHNFVKRLEKDVRADPIMKAIFINPKNNQIYKTGELYKRPKFAKTLRIIAKEGGLALNKGSLTKDFIKDIQDQGGIITARDLMDYKPQILAPVHTNVAQKDVYSFPLPATGALIIYILNILENYVNSTNPVSTVNVQRLAESLKFAYAQRSKLGDKDFVDNLESFVTNLTSKEFAKQTRAKIFDNKTFNDPRYYGLDKNTVEDHGTANICVWGPNGDGIAFTSSINYILGARFASKSTGIILNNSMNDFSSPGITNVYGIPPSSANFIQPGKRPLSSMAPTIIIDEHKDLFMVIGGAGGSKIIAIVAQAIINRLYYNMNVERSVDVKRIYHQLIPMNLLLEEEWLVENEEIQTKLREYGHNITYVVTDGFSAVTAISVDNASKYRITAVSDKRRLGSIAYFKQPHYEFIDPLFTT